MKNKKLFLFFVCFIIIVSGIYQELKTTFYDLLTARRSFQEKSKKYAELEKIKNLDKFYQKSFKTTAAVILPPYQKPENFLNDFLSSISPIGLEIITAEIKPFEKRTQKIFYEEIPLMLTMRGNYAQFLGLLNFINKQKYFVSLRNFTLSRSSSNAKARDKILTFKITAYYYQEKNK